MNFIRFSPDIGCWVSGVWSKLLQPNKYLPSRDAQWEACASNTLTAFWGTGLKTTRASDSTEFCPSSHTPMTLINQDVFPARVATKLMSNSRPLLNFHGGIFEVTIRPALNRLEPGDNYCSRSSIFSFSNLFKSKSTDQILWGARFK